MSPRFWEKLDQGDNMGSIWSSTVPLPSGHLLDGDLNTEVAVIGGGMAGILTARLLQDKNTEAVVLEGGTIGSGQTKNTTAKLTLQHDLIYHKLIQTFGIEKAKQYAEANRKALEDLRNLIQSEGINCHYRTCSAYLYTRNDIISLEQEAKAARRLGIEGEIVSQTELPFPVQGALCFPDQGQFHPLEFLTAVAKSLTVYSHTNVLSVKGNKIRTDQGTVTARKIIFTTHMPFINWPGLYFARMHQERSYVLALEQAQPLDGMYLGIDPDGLSFRSFENLLLLGGGGHRTGENSVGGKYHLLREAAIRFWPESREVAHWSAQDCMTLDGVPYIGQFSKDKPNWYVATGFGKWGMTSSMAAARILSELVVDGCSSNAEVFSPQRFPSAALMPLFREGRQSCKGIGRRLFWMPEETEKSLHPGQGGVVRIDGQKVGIYRDEEGTCHAVSVRCPHLGCQLEWNPDEKSWDCPCHGSRFDYDGNLIDNPAQENLQQK